MQVRKEKESVKITCSEPLSKKQSEEERVPTYIQGFDDAISGGFLKNSVNMIGGGAGSGKSIFCMQFLVNGIEKHNENCIYISFEEDEEKILRDMKKFGWNLEEKIKNKQLVILSYTPEEVDKVLETGAGTVRDIIDSIDAKRIVVDSMTAFLLLYKTEREQRKAALKLFESTSKWNCTTLITSEQEPDPERHSSTVTEFESDSVILLYNIRKGDVRERSIEIFKMRATLHSAKIFPMQITEKGIIVYPEQVVF
jgi:circadian clock protein KaiC